MTLPKDTPELADLDLFVSIVDRGSLTRAAALHFISQPSASARIARLERRLGAKLLDRTPRGSVPTEIGLRLAGHARATLEAAEEFARTAATLAATAKNRLRIVASYTMGDYVLPRWFKVLGDKLSDTSLSVRNSAGTVASVIAGEAELGFMCVSDIDEPLKLAPIGRDELVVVTSPDHHWVRRLRPLEPEHLASARLVVREALSGTRSQLDKLLEPYRPDPPPTPVLELGSTGAIKAAVMDGVAPAVLSNLTVTEELATGRLISVPVAGLDLGRTLFAAWQTGQSLSDEARTLLDFAQSEQARAMIAGLRSIDSAVSDHEVEPA
jgi:DNA-binding transcriptional LysR family regulator